ncbi:unnamed protein product [Ixodes persulcatus]
MLRRLGYRVEGESRSEQKISPNLRDKIKMVPNPRHKHPEYHGERRKARVEVFLRMCEGKMEISTRYTGEAKYAWRGRVRAERGGRQREGVSSGFQRDLDYGLGRGSSDSPGSNN